MHQNKLIINQEIEILKEIKDKRQLTEECLKLEKTQNYSKKKLFQKKRNNKYKEYKHDSL